MRARLESRVVAVRSGEDAPSGQNQQSKLKLLGEEGVRFDDNGMLLDKGVLWSDFDV